jgi:uncharacterized protein (TIGR04255 family)
VETQFDLLRLPDVPRIVLKHPPLVLALCQIRFSSVLGVADPATVAPFQRAIQSRYPVSVPVQELQLLVGFNPNEATFRREQRASPQWQFTDKEDNWKVVLSQDFLTLETRNYEHFDDFLVRLREALDALVKYIQPTVGTRIGLRYINEIRSESMNWSDIIKPELLGPIALPEFTENTVQVASTQQLLLRYPEEQGINIQTGFVPGGTSVRPRQGEEMQEKEFYLLDIDVFREFPSFQTLFMDPDTICHYVESYHKTIYRLFRWAVTDQYLSSLGG